MNLFANKIFQNGKLIAFTFLQKKSLKPSIVTIINGNNLLSNKLEISILLFLNEEDSFEIFLQIRIHGVYSL